MAVAPRAGAAFHTRILDITADRDRCRGASGRGQSSIAIDFDGRQLPVLERQYGRPGGVWDHVPNDGSARIYCADLDNNGAVDVAATGSAGTQIWLGDEKGGLVPLAAAIDARNVQVDNASIQPLLDLIGLDSTGKPVRLVNHSTRQYHWQTLRPRAEFVAVEKGIRYVGSKRINSFGVGGEVEQRAGLLYQKYPITGPSLHLGLGSNTQADAVRMFWPNGTNQAEFAPDIPVDTFVVARQRLDSSCPWLFAWNGSQMKMVTDCIWKSPLGLKINAQDSARVSLTQDWIKIRGDQLAPHDGFYDLRICAELWETHFFDYLELVAVDHPAGTDIFTDERFCVPPPPLQIHLTTPPVPVQHAVDDRGADVTDILRARDERYLDTFGRGPFQGVTRDHYVEVDLGPDLPVKDRLFLVANGWIHPTHSSINVAISHGKHDLPRSLSLELQDAAGKWVPARLNLGFPEGKVKNVLIDITGLFPKRPAPYRLRLRTNLEIYWDFIGWAKRLPPEGMKQTTIALQSADLRYRGFSRSHQKDASSPEMAEYENLDGSAPRWLDLEGYYTRYGEVSPLLTTIDDRYVIMNAGDELALRFPEIPPPPAGWKRDYVLKGDGWVKDGNFNTTFSQTVLPLPTHRDPLYTTPPTMLEHDPVYRSHREDWQTYHTRYVSPAYFRNAMRPADK